MIIKTVDKVIECGEISVLMNNPDAAGLGFIEPAEKIMQLTNWNDVINVLQELHGDNADVAVYPNSDILRFG